MTSHERIQPVIELLTRLATGDLDARGARIAGDEDLDAVIFGINMLAEELSASRTDLEKRIENWKTRSRSAPATWSMPGSRPNTPTRPNRPSSPR
ncbi:MAG: hypothetical protein HYU55_08160 [Nocardioides sp.]|nr:hypothetical protein [Nocardioides sp.]